MNTWSNELRGSRALPAAVIAASSHFAVWSPSQLRQGGRGGKRLVWQPVDAVQCASNCTRLGGRGMLRKRAQPTAAKLTDASHNSKPLPPPQPANPDNSGRPGPARRGHARSDGARGDAGYVQCCHLASS